MTNLDFILLLVLLGFTWVGFWFGLIHAAGGLVGTIAGAYIAGHFYGTLAAPFETLFSYEGAGLKLFAFIALFILVNRLVGFGFFLFDKTFAFLTRLPFLKTISRMAGGVLGLVEGALVVGLTLFFADSYLELPAFVESAIAASRVANGLTVFAAVLVPLLPELISRVQPYVPVELPRS